MIDIASKLSTTVTVSFVSFPAYLIVSVWVPAFLLSYPEIISLVSDTVSVSFPLAVTFETFALSMSSSSP